jgi:hypothetical protein
MASASVPLLEWDPNPESTVIGYNVYVGTTTRNYSQVIDTGPQNSFPLTNLNPGITYFFAVTAYDAEHLESPFSDEVFYTPPVDGITAATVSCTLTDSNAAKTVQFSGRTGQLCRIAASSDLRQWEEIFVTLGTGDSIEYVDSGAAEKPMRFYRVIVTPP